MILKDSRPRIIANLITENDGIGLFVRDKSNGVVQKNIVPLQNNIYIDKIKRNRSGGGEEELQTRKHCVGKYDHWRHQNTIKL